MAAGKLLILKRQTHPGSTDTVCWTLVGNLPNSLCFWWNLLIEIFWPSSRICWPLSSPDKTCWLLVQGRAVFFLIFIKACDHSFTTCWPLFASNDKVLWPIIHQQVICIDFESILIWPVRKCSTIRPERVPLFKRALLFEKAYLFKGALLIEKGYLLKSSLLFEWAHLLKRAPFPKKTLLFLSEQNPCLRLAVGMILLKNTWIKAFWSWLFLACVACRESVRSIHGGMHLE